MGYERSVLKGLTVYTRHPGSSVVSVMMHECERVFTLPELERFIEELHAVYDYARGVAEDAAAVTEGLAV